MTRRKKLARLPHLNDAGGDISKQWYVEYAIRNPKNDRMERFRVYEGLSDPSPEKRLILAEKIINEYSEKLKNGWSPLGVPEKYVYQDQLVYTEIAKVYGQQRSANGTVRFYASEWLKEVSAVSTPPHPCFSIVCRDIILDQKDYEQERTDVCFS